VCGEVGVEICGAGEGSLGEEFGDAVCLEACQRCFSKELLGTYSFLSQSSSA
jgi:hypothetical protein